MKLYTHRLKWGTIDPHLLFEGNSCFWVLLFYHAHESLKPLEKEFMVHFLNCWSFVLFRHNCCNIFFKMGNIYARLAFFLQSNFHFLFTHRSEKRNDIFNSLKALFWLLAASASQLAIKAVRFVFLQFKEFELYWGAVFFLKICSHIFMIFEVKLE